MSTEQDPYVRLVSTTRWVQETKIAPAAGGQRRVARRASRWFGLRAKNPREVLPIKIRFRAGPECYWEVHARGQVGYFSGMTSLHDAFTEIYQAGGHYPRC